MYQNQINNFKYIRMHADVCDLLATRVYSLLNNALTWIEKYLRLMRLIYRIINIVCFMRILCIIDMIKSFTIQLWKDYTLPSGINWFPIPSYHPIFAIAARDRCYSKLQSARVRPHHKLIKSDNKRTKLSGPTSQSHIWKF